MTATQGDLVNTLSNTDRNAYMSPRRGAPAVGSNTRCWKLDRLWGVWSLGPEPGTWWLSPLDHEATQLTAELGAMPSRGEPVVIKVAQGCIAVRSRDIRPTGR